ncbi:MAG: BACON domain-containing protein, partial [Longimicrobiales bacterium]
MQLALLALSLCACAYAQCTFTLSTPVTNFQAAGGTGVVTVTASATDCARPASTTVDWITIAFGQTGEGSGSVGFTVSANTTPANRNGSIVIGSQSLTITQTGADCMFSFSSNSASVGSGAATGSFTLNGSSACTWNVTANAPWLHLTSATSGLGSATITYSIDANTARNPRNGTIAAGGQTFTVTQAGTCSYTLDPGSAFHPAAGGAGTFNVASQSGCTWTATPSASWITLTFGQSGTANGSVGYSVEANTTVARSGSIQAGNQTFSITQDGVPCALTLSASSASFGVGGGAGTVGVSGPAGCAWTASTSAAWIRLNSGTSGTGNGPVGYTVQANSGPQSRSDLIHIGGQGFVVIQSGGACKYEISPASSQFPAGGGGARVSVNTTAGCPWTAATNAGWITITNIDGGGAGSAGY